MAVEPHPSNEGKVPVNLRDVLKDYHPIAFARVSSPAQAKNLPAQIEKLKQNAKELGFKKAVKVYAIQQSGFSGEQQNIKVMRELREKNPMKKYVALFRSVDRIGRDTEIALAMRRQFAEMGVPIITEDLPDLTGKNPYGNRSMDLLYIIFSGVAETGKEREIQARKDATKRSAGKGVIAGVPPALYPQNYTDKGKSVYRQLWEGQKAVAAGLMSNKALAKATGFLYTTNSPARRASKGVKQKRLGEDYRVGDGNTSQPRKILKELNAINERDPEKLKEYLDVVDAISLLEQTNNFKHDRARKPASLRTAKAKAMHRVSVAYLRDPFAHPNPVTVGNPEVARIVSNEGVGTVQDAFDNPEIYLVKNK